MHQITNQKEELLDSVNQDLISHFIKLVQMVHKENALDILPMVPEEMDILRKYLSILF